MRSAFPCLVLLSVALVLLVPTRIASAQDGSPDPDLPDIAPREYEIRGQLEISFPSLQRQPLIGFNPPPRLPVIPADRVPYVEEYKQESAELPPSPLEAPEPPGLAGLQTFPPARLELDATAGRYFSRTVRGRAALPFGQSEVVLASLDYRGLDSYRPFEDDAPHNLFDAEVGIATHRERVSAGADVRGFIDTYSLFGARRTGAQPVLTQPTRDGQGVQSAAWLRASSAAGADFRLRGSYGTSVFETDIFGETVQEGPDHRSEQRIGVSADADYPVGRSRLIAGGQFGRSVMDQATSANTGSSDYSAGAAVQIPLGRRLQITAGARLLGYQLEGDAAALEDAEVPKDRQIIAPDVRVEAYLTHGAMLYAHSRPALKGNDLSSLFERNPFLVAEPVVAPTLRSMEVEGGGRFYLGPLQVGLRGGYRSFPNLLYFEHVESTETGGYERGFSATRFGEATVAYAGGDLSLTVARGLQATLSVIGRHGRLSDDVVIPYFGPVVAEAMLSYSFVESRGLIQLTGTYESSRYRDRAQTRLVGDYFDLDLLASYRVVGGLTALVAVDNISADYLERYDGYPMPSFVFRGGLGLRW